MNLVFAWLVYLGGNRLPKYIVEADKAALDANQHHYTYPAGLPQFWEAIAFASSQ